MSNLKFWGAHKAPILNSKSTKPLGVPNSGSTFTKLTKPPKSKSLKFDKKVIARLGIAGVAVILVLGIVGVLGYIYIANPAYALISKANSLKSDFSNIGESLRSRDLVALEVDLTKTENDLKGLREDRDSKFSWAKNVNFLKLSEFYSDTDRFINAGLYSIDALREVETVVTPFADAAGLKVKPEQEVPQSEGLMEAFQQWVSIMPQVASKMDGVIAAVAKVGDELAPIDTSKYPEKIGNVVIRENIDFVKNTLSKADDYAPDIKTALTLFPRVLGVGTPIKRYMIIMQNDKELRPTGGFMTNYATFKIQNGLLQSDFTSKDMYSIDLTLDIIDATYDFPDAPPAYMKYLKVERWYARDMNASPDFIESMDQLMKFYRLASTINPVEVKAVDGIFAIDTNVIKELLNVTGPVTVNGVTYTADNVVIELEKIASLQLAEQANRKGVLGNLMQRMLINVFESDKNLWSKLIETGVNLAIKKDVLVYLFDTEAQAVVEKYGLAGRVTDPVTGDYSMIVSTNLGGDKTNWFTTKEVNHTLAKEGDKWTDTVKIKYTYTNPTGDYTLFAKRFRDWVRVLAPMGSQSISVDGTEDGTETGTIRNKTYFTGYVEMGPGESKEMTFKYYLPANVITNGTYNLLIQKQPGIESEIHRVTVNGNTQQYVLTSDKQISIKL